MKEARFKYKCRLCGEVEENPGTAESYALHYLIAAIRGDPDFTGGMTGNVPELLDAHNCEDGSFGVSDLIGYKVYEEA